MIVLITGATSGFGMSCAKLFSKKGYKTILIGRRKDRLTELSKELGVKRNLPIQLDVRDKKNVFQTIEELPNDFKKITVLINNAGLAWGLEPAHKIDIKKLLVRNEKTMVWADGLLSTADNRTIYFAKNLQVGLFNNLTYDFGGDPSQDSF